MMILIVLTFRDAKLPMRLALVAGALAMVSFGALGMLRQNYNSSSVNFDILSVDRFGDWLDASRAETIKRAGEEGDLAAFVAADEKLLLWGKSYLSVVAFPVPRGLWPQKPKNVYTYTNWIAFDGNDDGDMAASTWGIPTSSIAEAFWNFWWAGPVIVGGILGFILAMAQNLFRVNRYNPIIVVVYIQILVYFNASSRWALYFIQNSAGLAIMIFGAVVVDMFLRRHHMRNIPTLTRSQTRQVWRRDS